MCVLAQSNELVVYPPPPFKKKKKKCDRLTERHLLALGRKGGLKTVQALTFLLFPAAIKRVTPSFAKAGGRGGGVSRPARPRPRQISRQLHKRPVILREGQIPDQLVMLLSVAASARVVSSSSSSSLLSVPLLFVFLNDLKMLTITSDKSRDL